MKGECFSVVRFGHWVCGESWHAIKGSLTHHPSSQGWAPGVLPLCVCICMYVCVCVYLVVCLVFIFWSRVCVWWFGGGRVCCVLSRLLSFIATHVFHAAE